MLRNFHGVVPHLSTFGKAMGNGFAIAALVGKREIMRLGGLDHDQPRVFLLSTTHGAETHALAASLETIRIYKRAPASWSVSGGRASVSAVLSIVPLRKTGLRDSSSWRDGPAISSLLLAIRMASVLRLFARLFMQELIRRGVIAPSFVVSFSHTDADIDRTGRSGPRALCAFIAKALDEGIENYLEGRPVKPVNRKFN